VSITPHETRGPYRRRNIILRVIYLRGSRDAKRIIFDQSCYERSRVDEIIVSMVSRILWYIVRTRVYIYIYICIYITERRRAIFIFFLDGAVRIRSKTAGTNV